MRYKLNELFADYDDFSSQLTSKLFSYPQEMFRGFTQSQEYQDVIEFINGSIWYYFYEDEVAYLGSSQDVLNTFLNRISYDIVIKISYWKRKLEEIDRLLVTGSNLRQSSKMTSSSTDKTKTASGSLQKTATTPTGVTTGTAEDNITIDVSEDDTEISADVSTAGFVDKYTNAQQKYANAGKVEGERAGTIEREGSIDELIKVLEKLPASFGDEITKEVGKHFYFVYDR